MKNIINKLKNNKILSKDEFVKLLMYEDPETNEYLRECAVNVRKENYQNHVYIRGLIEISNICKNDCLYCGIRKSNKKWRKGFGYHSSINSR